MLLVRAFNTKSKRRMEVECGRSRLAIQRISRANNEMQPATVQCLILREKYPRNTDSWTAYQTANLIGADVNIDCPIVQLLCYNGCQRNSRISSKGYHKQYGSLHLNRQSSQFMLIRMQCKSNTRRSTEVHTILWCFLMPTRNLSGEMIIRECGAVSKQD